MGLSVELVTPGVTVDAGSVKCIEARVHNDGAEPCQLRFEVTGDAAGWSWVYPQSCEVGPGEDADVGVFFKPLAGPIPVAGTHSFGLKALCTGDPSASVSAEGTVEVRPYTEVVAALDPVQGRDRQACDYTLRLENQGNVSMTARLKVDDDAPRELAVHVQPAEVTAGPGDVAKATVHVEARKGLRKGERRFPICVRAQVEGGSELRADGAFYQLGKKPG